MKKNLIYSFLFTTGVFLNISCVDNNYDLSDIDTTSAIKIDHLTIPVRVNAINLDQILETDDEDALIQQYTDSNGKLYYAIRQTGSFNADPVMIDEVERTENFDVTAITLPADNPNVVDAVTPFSYPINDVDEALISLSYFELNPQHYMEISLSVNPASASLTDVQLQIPDTYVASYNNVEYSNGIIPVNIVNGALEYPVYVKTMSFNPPLSPDDQHTLTIEGEIGLKSATLSADSDVSLTFTLSPYTVNAASGTINYEIELPFIQSVELDNLPDFLTDGETTLILQNPQIYLDFASMYGAYYNTSLNIIPEGTGTENISISDLRFQKGILIAPDLNDLGISYSAENTVLKIDQQLQNILKGNGLPTSIDIEMDQSKTYLDGEVQMLPLGTPDGITVSGDYVFFAPLAFADGTQILYRSTSTDFFGDDVDDVNVSYFSVQADVTSEIPAEVTLRLYPLDKDGKRISDGNIYASGIVVPGSSHVNLEINETFTGLDGVEYEVISSDTDGLVLSPEQKIFLENIKATLSGEYVTSF